MTSNLSIKKKLLIYSFLIQLVILMIFSISLYKALEISTLDKLQATLKIIILDVTDEVLENNEIENILLDEEKEYNFEPLYIRILDNKTHKKIIQTSNFPDNIEQNDEYLNRLKENTVIFEKQNNYLVSRIKIKHHEGKISIIEIATTKDILTTTLENILSQLKKINANDLSARLNSSKNEDEINQLVNEVNSLLKRLEASFEKISQFSSDASHELKTPLTIIRGEIEIALRKERSIDEYKDALNSSLNEIIIIEQTINDLLFLAKNEKDLIIDKQETFYFDEIVDESINEIKSFANLHKIDIKFILEDTIEFNGYSNLLKIAIKNILKNAIQFSHKNSQVIVKNYKKDGFFNISVQDFGIGIEQNEQIKIFEKFYRTDKSRNKNSGGTGLGMSILKKIVDIHGGIINIYSKEDFGTTITISFPNKNNFI